MKTVIILLGLIFYTHALSKDAVISYYECPKGKTIEESLAITDNISKDLNLLLEKTEKLISEYKPLLKQEDLSDEEYLEKLIKKQEILLVLNENTKIELDLNYHKMHQKLRKNRDFKLSINGVFKGTLSINSTIKSLSKEITHLNNKFLLNLTKIDDTTVSIFLKTIDNKPLINNELVIINRTNFFTFELDNQEYKIELEPGMLF